MNRPYCMRIASWSGPVDPRTDPARMHRPDERSRAILGQKLGKTDFFGVHLSKTVAEKSFLNYLGAIKGRAALSSLGSTPRSSGMTAERARAHQGHIAEKATIDHLIRILAPVDQPAEGRVLAPVTESGLLIEDQVRKAWNQPVVGLAIF